MNADTGLYDPGRSQHWDSSGFQMREQVQRQTRFAPRSSSRPMAEVSVPVFTSGDRVMHDKFGEGTVIHVDGHKLDIAFDTGGHKRVMDNFVTKT
jgi:DNA helicase-2/ATP-dependent DNA helicase PcrA